MTHLTLATIIRRRVPLVPREAAALTLAVAAQWDRERARDGTRGLPDARAIRLHSTGEISFHARRDGVGSLTLSALLGQLLGIDEPAAPRGPVPGGLLITIAGKLGQMDLPSQTEDGFRAALTRFADEDPAVLQKVFRRAARACRVSKEREPRPAYARLADRRRQPPVVTDLRREIRDLEQQVFESAAVQEQSAGGMRAGYVRPAVAWIGLATIASALVAAIGFLLAAERATRTAPARATHAGIAREALTAAPPVAVPERHEVAARTTAAGTDRRLVTHRAARRTASRRQTAATRAVSFAGGTRAIGWLPARP